MNKRVRFYPLAITEIDEERVCVAGITEDGLWVRPEPLFRDDILEGEDSAFSYQVLTEVTLTDSTATERRIEDYDIVRAFPIIRVKKASDEEWAALLRNHCDNSVNDIFGKNRSIGLIRPRILDIGYRRSIGGGRRVRIKFSDTSNTVFDLVVADRQFRNWVISKINERGELEPSIRDEILNKWSKCEVYFSVGLTRKTTVNFPGPYGGCHALVVGVHTIPNCLYS